MAAMQQVYPLLGIRAFHVIGSSIFIAWLFMTRDHTVNRKKKAVNERMDLLKPHYLKLLVITPYLKPAPELHECYEEMEEAQKQKDQEIEDMRKQDGVSGGGKSSAKGAKNGGKGKGGNGGGRNGNSRNGNGKNGNGRNGGGGRGR